MEYIHYLEWLDWEYLETQRIANRQISSKFGIPSVFGIDGIRKTGIIWKNMEYILYLESLGWNWLENQRIANRRYSSVIWIPLIPNTDLF